MSHKGAVKRTKKRLNIKRQVKAAVKLPQARIDAKIASGKAQSVRDKGYIRWVRFNEERRRRQNKGRKQMHRGGRNVA